MVKYKNVEIKSFTGNNNDKNHWSWERFQALTDSMLKGRPYFTCALPYQLGVREGIIMKDRILNEMKESDFNEQLFKMEMETIPYGESEKAFFKFADLTAARKVETPIVPMSDIQFLQDGGKTRRPEFLKFKQRNQIRVLSMDVASMASGVGRYNDATVFTLITATQQGKEYIKTIDYIESLEGELIQKQALRAKRLFYELDCDFFVVDANGIGSSIFDVCTEKTMDYERGTEYPAWTVCNDDEMAAARCKDYEAMPVMYAVKVTGYHAGQMIHDMALYVKSQFQNGKISLLINETEASEILEVMKEFKRLDTEDQIRVKTAYIQTTLLINEMINLEAEIRSNLIKLVEPSARSRKDRYYSLAYGLYFLKEKELQLKAGDDGRDDIDFFMKYTYF